MTDTVCRDAQWRRLAGAGRWDLLVVGGGALGLGTALECRRRGLSVALVEQHDFASGTSSRSTKLIHGGVRYLEQGDLKLVRDALRQRRELVVRYPEIVRPLPFHYSNGEHLSPLLLSARPAAVRLVGGQAKPTPIVRA